MNTDDLRTNLETCLRDARNNNEDIPQLISTISGNSEGMKQILETINSMLQCESMINKQKQSEDVVTAFDVERASIDKFPVMSLAAKSEESNMMSNFDKTVGKFAREDHTLCISADVNSDQIFLSGIGDMHLDIYTEKLKKECDLREIRLE